MAVEGGASRAGPGPSAAAPEIAVVVPSHERPLRLRWLLNALEEQTLPAERFEVVVVHDSAGPETERLLNGHPLAAAGVLRHLSFPPGTGFAALQRNAGWRAARAPLILFTDDDCRPPPDWLERALAAARRHPGAVVGGAIRPDPDEAELLHSAAHVHTLEVEPPDPWAPTANILYPRELLERAGGFEQETRLEACDDTELALRCRALGAPFAGAPEMLVFHAVEVLALPETLRRQRRWRDLAFVVKRHPELREALAWRMFWTPVHARFGLAILAGVLAVRRPAAALGALPWALAAAPSYGRSPRGRVRALAELPGRAAVNAAEMVALLRGSVRYRTLIL